MRDRQDIEKDVPGRVDLNDNHILEIPRNSQKLLTLILEVALDIRDEFTKKST
jgi:hypothetical protein